MEIKEIMHRFLSMVAAWAMFSAYGVSGYIPMGQYSNGKYGFSVEYPGHLFIDKQIPNAGDGIVLLGIDGLEYRVYGSWCMERLRSSYGNLLQWEKEAGSRISYKVLKRNWFVVSGFLGDGKSIFYQKTYQKDDVCISARIRYRARDKAKYDTLVSDLMEGIHY